MSEPGDVVPDTPNFAIYPFAVGLRLRLQGTLWMCAAYISMEIFQERVR